MLPDVILCMVAMIAFSFIMRRYLNDTRYDGRFAYHGPITIGETIGICVLGILLFFAILMLFTLGAFLGNVIFG